MQLNRRRLLVSRRRDERGVALIVAIVVALVVVLLSTAAIEQSVDTITQAGIAGKQVSSTDAAEAGIQSIYHGIVTATQTQQAGPTVTCPAPTASTTLTSTAAFTASYYISCSTVVGSTTTACTACVLTPGSNFLIQSTGTTTAKTLGSKTMLANVTIPTGLTGTKSVSFPEVVYAGTTLDPATPGTLSVSEPSVDLTGASGFGAASTGGDVYTGITNKGTTITPASQCNASGTSIGGNYYELAQVPSPPVGLVAGSLSGPCSIAGDVVVDNPTGVNSAGVNLTGGSGVVGSIYTSGPLSLTGAAQIIGSGNYASGQLWSDGNLNICPPTNGYVVVYGPVTTGGTTAEGALSLSNLGSGMTFCAGTVVGGDINSAGTLSGVLQAYGSFGVYANGQITLTNSHVNGTLLGEQGITATNTSVGGTYGVIAGGPVVLNNVTAPGVSSESSVTLNGGTYGGVESVGPLTIENGATINGTVYGEDGVTFAGTASTITPATGNAAVENEYGTVNCNNNAIGGGLYYYDTTITKCTAGASGPTSIHSYTAPLNSQSSPGGAPPDDYPPQSDLGINGVGGYNYSDPTNTTNYINTATSEAINTIDGSPGGTTKTAVAFPTLTYDASSWYANNSFCGRGTAACTASTMREITDNDCSTSTTDTTSFLSEVNSMTTPGQLPTVIVTSCQYSPPATTTGLALDGSLAIFDTGGFTIPASFANGFSSGDGNTHQLYLIVPSGTVSSVGATCGLGDTSPDIVADAPLTDASDRIQDFLYTPGSICNNSGSTSIYGKVYAGTDVEPSVGSSTWTQLFYDISPWTATPGTSTLFGTPSVQSVTQIANPIGFS